MMTAFSTNTNILLSPSQLRIFTPSPNLVKTHSKSNLVNNNNYNYNNNNCTLNTSTAFAPIFSTASPDVSATAAAEPDVGDSASTSITSRWAEFAENVSGEWDGFGADFTAEGKPIQLPESVVPEAYREWEVKVFDWQTQCPTLAQSHYNNNNSSLPSLMYKTIKLLPTVGCEADAATIYTILERNVSAPHNSAFAYQSTGSYVAVWPCAAKKSMELEHCLIDPSNKESRVRIIQVIELQEPDDQELKLLSIRVFVEQWYGPFRNGDQLGGCAIRDSAFAATQPLKASKVSGVWQGIAAVANFQTCHHNMMIRQLGDECTSKSIRDEGDLILLPKQLWCSVKRAENNETCCEVGWLLDEGRAITSKCVFSSTAQLQEIAIARETATPV